MESKRIIIIAGPNGAGKTTFANAFLPGEAQCRRFINADLIAAGLSPFAPDAQAIKAGRLMLEEMAACVARNESFAFETTLAGVAYLRHIEDWRGRGYHVSLHFLGLPRVEMAIARVAERVRQGGHDIPEPVIRRRFVAGRKNFESRYRAAVDAWTLYDSSGTEPVMNEHELSKAKDKTLAGAMAAMRRAARAARELAVRTGTAIIVLRDGKIVRVSADELRKQGY